MTDWFPVLSCLKQGFLLFPLLFNLFANDLGEAIDATGLGIDMNGVTGKLSMLMYADDLALIVDTEEDLQKFLTHYRNGARTMKCQSTLIKQKLFTFETPRNSALLSVSLAEIKQLMLPLHIDILVVLLTNI